MDKPLVLLVDDEQAILRVLEVALRKEGFNSIAKASTGGEAIAQCRMASPAVVILDIMLPDYDGLEVCRRIRQFSDAPILFLTAKADDVDKIIGLGIGGDDYITKPFNPLEVVARIKAHLRRLELSKESSVHIKTFDFGRFQVSESNGQLVVAGKPVICPAREFQLLLFFCKHPDQILSREQLYDSVWGHDSFGDDTTVNVHIRRLREKIEQDPGNPCFLVTVRGLGYKLVPADTVGQ